MSKGQAEPPKLTKQARNRRFKLMAMLLAATVLFIVPEVLQTSLSKKQPDEKWLVHNAGVHGYSSHQMRPTSRRRSLLQNVIRRAR